MNGKKIAIKTDNPGSVSCRGFRCGWAATYFPTLSRSIIGAAGLNFSVRDGKRCAPALLPPLGYVSRGHRTVCSAVRHLGRTSRMREGRGTTSGVVPLSVFLSRLSSDLSREAAPSRGREHSGH